MRPLGVAAMLLKGSAKCVYLCVPVRARPHVCVWRARGVVQCLIEQDGAPPALIPLHFIGLDGPSYNCIRALSPSIPQSACVPLTPRCTDHASPRHTSKTPGGDEEDLCRGQPPPAPSFLSPLVKVLKVVIMLQTAVLPG